ncbi:variant erythrocyte surface antigen-1, beta subunit [Babesia caballi]|uniref:Variant erythrocyte surface antigen-1, beta subunit n=1 Tax=Babesia caballi TaxID=5871 RepID=A0AAV4LMK0_BABCB|nr:variant erythrocyte surface antigen-1, beta subunit [Babesia caballi]
MLLTGLCGFGVTVGLHHGRHKYTKLANALNTLDEFTDAKNQALGQRIYPQGVIKSLANKLKDFLGHMSQGGGFDFTGDKGIIEHGKGYTSNYQGATWDGSDQDKDMAQIFLGSVIITFLSLSFLGWKCSVNHGLYGEKLADTKIWGLGPFMKGMGYEPKYLNGSKRGQDVAQLLEDGDTGFDGLVKPDDSSTYENFVRKLEEAYKPEGSNALSNPLTAFFKFARVYFTPKFQNGQGAENDGTLKKIKKSLEAFRISCTTSAQDLQSEVGSFISTNMPDSASSQPDTPDTPPSSAGPVAGALTTLGLGGGAAAAYLLNVGGAKTLVNGLLKIG